MPELPPEVAPLAARIDDELREVLDEARDRLVGLHGDAAPLAEELRRFVLRGGKRLRPLFVLLGHRAGGAPDDAAAVGPALAVEMLHTCALVHDDLIDGAATRRGGPAVHVALDAGRGDGRFGAAAAILLGDLAHVMADGLFFATSAPPARLRAAFRIFTTMREEVTVGQYLDVHAASRRVASADVSLAIARLKSARYSVARPLELGATLAGDDQVAAGLAAAGLPLGEAFQLRDDILGVFGAADETGKPTDSDLAEGKRTLLVANTLERLTGAGRARFERLLGKRDLSADEAAEVRRLMRDSGGLEATRRHADGLVDEAMEALRRVELAPPVRTALESLAGYLIARRR